MRMRFKLQTETPPLKPLTLALKSAPAADIY